MSVTETELKVRSLRIDENTFEKFKNIAVQEFGNQGQCLSALVNLYETEKSKGLLSDRKTEIESFQLHINKLNELFLSSLSINQDTEERVKSHFEKLLQSKDSIIADLQERLKTALASATESSENLNALKNHLKEKDERIKKLENDSEKAELLYAANIEEKNVLCRALEDSCNEKSSSILSLKNEIEILAEKLEKFKVFESENNKLREEIEKSKSIISNLENNVSTIKKHNQYELEKVILNMEKEKQDTFAEMNLKHNDYIREYIFKIEDLNSRYNNDVSFMNTQIQNLASEKNRLELENEKLKFEIQKLKFEI